MTEIEELRAKLAASERRAEEPEAQAAAMRHALSSLPAFICDTCRTLSHQNDGAGASDWPCFCASWRNDQAAALASSAGRALLDRMHAAEAKVARLENEIAASKAGARRECRQCGGSGYAYKGGRHGFPCAACDGSGAVIVEGAP